MGGIDFSRRKFAIKEKWNWFGETEGTIPQITSDLDAILAGPAAVR